MIYFITGGQRSGKSTYGQKLALELSDNPIYLATSRIWDEDHKARIERHKIDRDEQWTTIEEEKFLSAHDFTNKTVVIDCVTLWLTNFFMDSNNDVDRSLEEAKTELSKLFRQDANFIIISNELGMGLHAETEIGRKFADLQGWMNQFIAAKADKVYLMISGIPVKVK
jgi:adenosylcobinamide kinase/adenosylcobinamide-phosphate guanylyltransferase